MSNPGMTPEQQAVLQDFRTSIGKVFKSLYDEKWDEGLWNTTIGTPVWIHRSADAEVVCSASFETRHAKPDIAAVLKVVGGWESWDDCKAYFKTGPPPFLREGWVSPLVGQKVDLGILEDSSAIRWVNGAPTGWKDAKAILVVFWAT